MCRRLIWFWQSAAFSILLLLAAAAPGAAAATAYPGHRQEQWWFVAWNIENKVWKTTQGEGVTVAVLDTGVNASVSELAGAVLPGFDALQGSGDGRTDSDPGGHGTAMANLIAAQGGGNNYLGVAPKAKILPVTIKSGSDSTVDPNHDPTASGIRYAVDHGAKVINLSYFVPSSCPSGVQDAVAYAISHDVVLVAGAGNSGQEGNSSGYPANCAGVLAVGAIDYKLRAWPDTERQSYVAVAAPGVSMITVRGSGRLGLGAGTSDASALTSGAVALVRSHYPKMSARDVVQRIIASTRDAGSPGKDEATGYGVVRPYQALVNNVPKNAPNPVFAAYDEWVQANGKGGSGQDSAGKNSKPSESTNPGIVLGVILVVIVGGVLLLAKIARSRQKPAVPPPGAWGPGAPQVPQQQFGPPSFGQPPAGMPGHPPAGWSQPPGAPPGRGAQNPAAPPSPYGPSDQGNP